VPVTATEWNTLKGMTKLARKMILEAGDKERIDVLSEVRETERGLASERRLAMAEVAGGDMGIDWGVEIGRRCNRTFNSQSLIVKFADASGKGVLETIGYLASVNVLEFKWNWTKLKSLIQVVGIDVTTVQREIESGDDADVGEVWHDGYPSFVRVADMKENK